MLCQSGTVLNFDFAHVHPNFSLSGNGSADVALLHLVGPIYSIKPIALIDLDTAGLEANGSNALFAGWGQNEVESSPIHASWISLTVLDFETCEAMLSKFPWPVHFNQLTAFYWNVCTFDFRHKELVEARLRR